ncbi:hypothetical protein NCDO763_0379 [Lactococcus cremoris]|nr:hypothetical protein N41_2135 [Lactococcus cremoris]KZK43908.1 hypothetical protein B40_1418 [Lactococcus cremoris]KZK53117.1 hypothetical protein NCDO763_0379 [Lactococcus cremoris]
MDLIWIIIYLDLEEVLKLNMLTRHADGVEVKRELLAFEGANLTSN